MRRTPLTSSREDPSKVRTAMATPPTYHEPIRHEPACHIDNPASPHKRAPPVIRLKRSPIQTLTLHEDGGPPEAGSTSRRKIAAGETSRIRNNGQSAKSSVVRRPKATP